MSEITAYPLQWPVGWKKTSIPKKSQFRVSSFAKLRNELINSLKLMNAKNVIISSNIPLNTRGEASSLFSRPFDKGAAIYFTYKDKQMVFACDIFNRVEDNIKSITNTINAIRGIERWGASEMLERAFTGFAQLNSPDYEKTWYELLGVNENSTKLEIKAAWKKQSLIHHPDKEFGSEEMIKKINSAYEKGINL